MKKIFVLMLVIVAIFVSCGKKVVNLDDVSLDNDLIYYKNKVFTGRVEAKEKIEGNPKIEFNVTKGKLDGNFIIINSENSKITKNYSNGVLNKIEHTSKVNGIKYKIDYKDGKPSKAYLESQGNKSELLILILTYDSDGKPDYFEVEMKDQQKYNGIISNKMYCLPEDVLGTGYILDILRATIAEVVNGIIITETKLREIDKKFINNYYSK